MKHFYCFLFLWMAVSLSAQEEIIIPSPQYLKTNDTVWVRTPSDLDLSKKYPVVFLMHGHGGSYKDYLSDIKFQDVADRYGFILVTTNGSKDCWYINSPNPDDMQYESYFFNQLIPEIDKRYPTDTDNRFITGFSMGGHGAMWLFLQRPDYFRTAGSSSGVLELRFSGAVNGSLKRILGDYDNGANKNFHTYSCINNLENIAGSDKYIYFDCGTSDHLYQSALLFRQRCDALNVKARSVIMPGKHDGAYFDEAFYLHFEFFKNQVK